MLQAVDGEDSRVPHLLFCGANTLAIGLMWEMSGNQDWQDMLANGLGIIGSDVMIVINW
jgi:hypothetical protein